MVRGAVERQERQVVYQSPGSLEIGPPQKVRPDQYLRRDGRTDAAGLALTVELDRLVDRVGLRREKIDEKRAI